MRHYCYGEKYIHVQRVQHRQIGYAQARLRVVSVFLTSVITPTPTDALIQVIFKLMFC